MTTIGVDVTTSLRSGPSNAGVISGRFQIAALAQKGPTGTSTVLKSIAEFESKYGVRTSYNSAAYDTARLFWEEGGSELVMTRVVGPAATRGSLTLVDQATPGVNTILVTAKDAGPASDNLSVSVVTDLVNDTFTLTVTNSGAVVAVFANITSPSELVIRAASNPYVTITSLGSVTTAPENNPVAIAATPLTAGTDDRASVTAASMVAALDAGGTLARGGAVAVPGYSADVIGTLLAAHAKAHSKIALLSMAADDTDVEVAAAGATVTTAGNGDAAGIFHPHLIIPDGTSTRTVEPTGYVAAARARAHRDVGFWQVPAGDRARVRWALGTATVVDTIKNNELADDYVNAIVTTGARLRLYNWSSLSSDRDNLSSLIARDSLNNLSALISEALEPHVFAPLDGRRHLLGFIESAVVGVLDPISKRNGFFVLMDAEGNTVDPGYRVVVDAPLGAGGQPPSEILVSAAVRLAPSADLIRVEIIKVALQASV